MVDGVREVETNELRLVKRGEIKRKNTKLLELRDGEEI